MKTKSNVKSGTTTTWGGGPWWGAGWGDGWGDDWYGGPWGS